MKIAFDAKRLFFNTTGLGNYSRSLVREIRALEMENEILLFTPSSTNVKFDYFLSKDYEIHTANGKKFWRYKKMVDDLKVVKPDIYHGLSNELPMGIEKLNHTKSIVTIHDLIFIKFPKYYPFIDRVLYKEKFKRACETADHIIAVSEATKNDIVELFKISEQKISVIYQSCSTIFYEEASLDVLDNVRPYFMFVSSITERKNLKLILDSLSKFSREERPKLVVVGEGGKYKQKMLEYIKEKQLEEDVDFKGYVDNFELKSLYRQALCTIYPSFYEGFGIPILESLLSGTPVIASNISSMPEAASGIGKLINPYNADELYVEMIYFLNNRERISTENINLLKEKFHPKTLAKQVLNAYANLLKC